MTGLEIPFEMRLSHGALGAMAGTIVDGAGGVPEEAVAKGRIVLRSMRFLKRYPHLWTLGADALQGGNPVETLENVVSRENPESRENLVSRGEPETLGILRGVAPVPVRYVGYLSADGCAVEGIWSIRGTVVSIDGRWMWMGRSSGFWRAERIELGLDLSPRA